MNFTRRRFLEASAAGVAALGGAACATDDTPDEHAVVDDGPAGGVPVAVVRNPDVDAAVERAVTLAGGVAVIKRGDVVFVKPNAVHSFVVDNPGIIPGLDLLAAVIRLLKDLGATVIVGDRSARDQPPSQFVFEKSGILNAATEAGADEVYPAPTPTEDPSAWVTLTPPHFEETWAAPGGILAMRKIVEADHLFEVPQCKNHRWAGFSLSMKNLMGAIGDDSRDPMHFTDGDPERLARDIAILNQMFTPVMCVIDARTTLVNGGPEGVLGDRVAATTDLVLAGADRVALDALGCSIIRREALRATVPFPDPLHEYLKAHAVWQQPQLRHGAELLGGVTRAADVRLRFSGVPADDIDALVAKYRE